MRYRAYDSRTDETLFESDERIDCVYFIDWNYDEGSDVFPHIWIGRIINEDN